MFKLDSETALLDTFRPRDRKKVELPAGLTFPLMATDYYAWPHPSGGRVYLEIAFDQGELALDVAREYPAFENARVIKDFHGNDRVLTATLCPTS